jgi:uncharacterized protein YjbI with pentapeptide repeats
MVSEPVPRNTTPAVEGRVPRQPLSRWVVPAVASAVLVISAVVLVFLWAWVDRLGLGAKDRATAQLDVVKVVSGIAVGGGGLFALYLAARRQRTQELELIQRETVHELAVRVAENTEKDAAERRVTDLYAKAVEQLGSDKAPVRLGGMYALRRLAQDDPRQRQTIVDVLCAYLRMPFTPPGEDPDEQSDPAEIDLARARNEERQVRLAAQRILRAHLTPGRAGESAENYWPDIDIDLTGATLIDFAFGNCQMRTAVFDRARFVGAADFSGASFLGGASFHKSTFRGEGNFSRTKFMEAAVFVDAVFCSESSFYQAIFREMAYFQGVKFEAGASFSGSAFKCEGILSRVDFFKSHFCGDAAFGLVEFDGDVEFISVRFDGSANFSGARFGAIARFDEAVFAEGIGFNKSVGRDGQVAPLSPAWVRLDVHSKTIRRRSWPPGWSVVAAEGRSTTDDTSSWGTLVESGPGE